MAELVGVEWLAGPDRPPQPSRDPGHAVAGELLGRQQLHLLPLHGLLDLGGEEPVGIVHNAAPLEEPVEGVAGVGRDRLHRRDIALAVDGNRAVATFAADVADAEPGRLGGAQPVEEEEADQRLVAGPGILSGFKEEGRILAGKPGLGGLADPGSLHAQGGHPFDGAGVDRLEVVALDRGEPAAQRARPHPLRLQAVHPDFHGRPVGVEEADAPDPPAPPGEAEDIPRVLGRGGRPVMEEEPAEELHLEGS